jgi:hypothetical protein
MIVDEKVDRGFEGRMEIEELMTYVEAPSHHQPW